VSIERFRHDAISTFGIGADVTELQWRSVLRQLITQGMVVVDAQSFSALHVSDAGRSFLRSQADLQLRKATERSERERDSGKKSANSDTKRAAIAALDTQGERIIRNLKTWRAAIAKEHNLPAYVIFHDATLLAIATLAPYTLDDLSAVSGMGARKLAAYGQDVLRVVDSQRDDG
jgi:ATP-dependent DNA helicase RecQ